MLISRINKNNNRRNYIKVTLNILVIVIILLSISCTDHNRKRERYLIPEGYAGWLCITYGVQGYPPLQMQDGFRLVKFSDSGVFITSSPQMPGHDFKDEFYFYSENVKRPLKRNDIGGGYTTSQGDTKDKQITFKFWVSNDVSADYIQYVKDKDSSCGPFRK